MNPPPPKEKVWTTRKLIAWTHQHFESKAVESPRLAAELLLAHVLETTRLKLYMDPDRPATQLERAAFRDLVERAAEHEPVDYLIGESPFFSMMLDVSPAVLVPRPSTEAVVEHIIQRAKRTPGFAEPLIADVGTGSGAIAIACVKHLPNARAVATDISEDALNIARQNARKQNVADRIDFRQGDLLEPLRDFGGKFHFLAANPPYISDAEWKDVPANVKNYEPTGALRGGTDGLDYIRQLIAQGPDLIEPAGQLVLEIAASQKTAALDLAAANPQLKNPHILPDHESLPRVLIADRKQ